MMTQPPKITRIHWRDASYRPGWHSAEEVASFSSDDYVIETVGWLVAESDANLVVALSYSNHRIGDVLIVPQSAVIDRWDLSEDE